MSDNFDLDNIIERLLAVRNSAPGQLVQLTEDEITELIESANDIIMDQPVLIEINSPVNICGDIHGQYSDLLRLFEAGGFPPNKNYLFLGDYVDRGRQNIETICLLLAYKVKYPENFFLLRGNHESDTINRIYGFYDECKRRFSVKLWKKFTDIFNNFPLVALLEDRILCMHGGLSPVLGSLDDIKKIQRPTDIPDSGLICDLVWSDPDPKISGWGSNERGVSFTFGNDVLKNFCNKNNIELIVRGHQVVEDGYEFFGNRGLVTVFSAPNYCDEFDNNASILSINENITCRFIILYPAEKRAHELQVHKQRN